MGRSQCHNNDTLTHALPPGAIITIYDLHAYLPNDSSLNVYTYEAIATAQPLA